MKQSDLLNLSERMMKTDMNTCHQALTNLHQASGISDMKRMLELVLDELRKQGIDIKDRQEFKDGYLPF